MAALDFLGARFEPATAPLTAESFGVAASPDGKNVYTGGQGLTTFGRDPITGALSVVDTEQNGVDGADGIQSVDGVAVSPDGKHVYVVGLDDNALAVFTRNPTTGALTFLEVHKDGVGPVDGLAGAYRVALSPDGKNVYATGYADDAVAVFGRNTVTGSLTFIEMQKDGMGGVDGLDAAIGVAVSPDGKNVYVTGDLDDAVAVFTRNTATGALSFLEMKKDGVSSVDGLDGAFAIAVSPDGNDVYVASDENALAVFSRDPATGALTFVEVKKDGVDGVDGLDEPLGLAVSPDGTNVYAVSPNDAAVAMFSRKATTGALTFLGTVKNGVGGVHSMDVPIVAAASPDGRNLYVTEEEHGIAVLSRNQRTGTLAFSGVTGWEETDAALVGARGAAMNADGSWLFVTASTGAMTAFQREPATGGLTTYRTFEDGVGGVSGIVGAFGVATFDSPGLREVFVTGYTSNAVAIFTESAFVNMVQDGVSGVDGIAGARSVAVSPDGKNVYVAGELDNAIAVFDRPIPLYLFFNQKIEDGVGSVDGLQNASAVTVSRDGKSVYATGLIDDAVAVFSRNTMTGQLTFLEVHKDGDPGVDGLDGPVAVAVSPDDKNVYVAGSNDNALAVFSRNTVTGLLTFLQVHKDGVAGVQGLNVAYSVQVSPDGGRVYVTGVGDNAVAQFARNATTGALTFVEAKTDGVDGVDGLEAVEALAASPDGRHLYAASFTDAAVAIFQPATTLRGQQALVKDPKPGVDPSKRQVKVAVKEKVSPDLLAGDPVLNGATLRIEAAGTTSTEQRFILPAEGWKAAGTTGFKYGDSKGLYGPIKKAKIAKATSGKFSLKIAASGKLFGLGIVPPNLGTGVGLSLTIFGGDTYCVRLGGLAGGTVAKNLSTAYQVKNATAEKGCP